MQEQRAMDGWGITFFGANGKSALLFFFVHRPLGVGEDFVGD
jgi:hypothetical protein